MRAVVFTGAGEPLQVEELTLEAPRAGEVKVRLVGAGVCHSDLHVYKGDWNHKTPLVLGHEGAGVVTEVGPGVTTPAVGDHVILSWMPPCGECRWCASGKPQLCETSMSAIGTDMMFDGTTRLSRAGRLARLPLPLLGGVRRGGRGAGRRGHHDPRRRARWTRCRSSAAPWRPGSARSSTPRGWSGAPTVAVIGCGAVGLSAIQGARLCAATRIVAVDVVPAKLEAARAFGATDVVDSHAGRPGGRGPRAEPAAASTTCSSASGSRTPASRPPHAGLRRHGGDRRPAEGRDEAVVRRPAHELLRAEGHRLELRQHAADAWTSRGSSTCT